MKLCTQCGAPCLGSRCEEHKYRKASATTRGYDAAWERLTREARRLQPWCTDCHSPGTPSNPLTVDHSPQAWAKVQSGKRLTLKDFRNGDLSVVCRKCNIARGAARGNSVER